jgi:hypothetical protein
MSSKIHIVVHRPASGGHKQRSPRQKEIAIVDFEERQSCRGVRVRPSGYMQGRKEVCVRGKRRECRQDRRVSGREKRYRLASKTRFQREAIMNIGNEWSNVVSRKAREVAFSQISLARWSSRV